MASLSSLCVLSIIPSSLPALSHEDGIMKNLNHVYFTWCLHFLLSESGREQTVVIEYWVWAL